MFRGARAHVSGPGIVLALLTAGAALSAQPPASDTPPDALLLKDYRPRSIYKIPQTEVVKAKVPVIDMHSHVYVKKHPRVTFIACHFANTTSDLSLLARMLDTYPNLYADIAARFGETAPIPRTMARFYERYQDRLLYGTDMGTDAGMYRATFRILETTDEHFYLEDLRNYHWAYHGFGLPDEILRKVYRDNARKVMMPARR